MDVGSRICGEVVFSLCGSTTMMIYDIKVLFWGVERNINTKVERSIVSLREKFDDQLMVFLCLEEITFFHL